MKLLTTLEQLDAQIIMLTEVRDCDKCGSPSWTMERGQRTLGRHVTCMKLPLAPELREAAGDRARRLMFRTFPGSGMSQEKEPELVSGGSYGHDWELVQWPTLHLAYDGRWWWAWTQGWAHSLDAGPCTRCQKTIRRYGRNGRATCRECA